MNLASIDKFNERIASLDEAAIAEICDQFAGRGKRVTLGVRFTDGGNWIYEVRDDGIRIVPGGNGADVTLELRPQDWERLAGRERTVAGLIYERNATVMGDYAGYLAWEPILEHLLYGDALYTSAIARSYRERIAAGELEQVFRLDDLDAAIEFMRDWGFVRIRSVFSAAEITELRDEVRNVVANVEKGDRDAWWTADGSDGAELARVNYLGRRSEVIAEVHRNPVVARIIAATGLAVTPMNDRMDGEFVILKTTKVGEKDTFTNLPWHKDCGLGMHGAICPSCIIGIQLTAASPVAGQLMILAGSHKSANNGSTAERLGELAPVIGVETDPGDITLHFSHVLHAAPPPQDPSVGRQTLYVQFYPQAIKDHVAPFKGLNDMVLDYSAGGAMKPLKEAVLEAVK